MGCCLDSANNKSNDEDDCVVIQMGSASSASNDHDDNKITQQIVADREETPPMTRALSHLKYQRQPTIDNATKKSYSILVDIYLAQIHRNCTTFTDIEIPREVVAICISYCETLDGSLYLAPNTFVQLNANYEYVYETMIIGESSTLSAKQNDKSKAKMTIFCFGDITLHPYSYLHLSEGLKLSSYVGYAIYIETFGTIYMMENSHIDIDSRGASIFIKCKQLLMKEGSRIKARNGKKIVLVITDEKNRNDIKSIYTQPGCNYFYPSPEVHAKSPPKALGNIQSVELVDNNQAYEDFDETSTFSAESVESSTFSANEVQIANVVTIGLPQYNTTTKGTPDATPSAKRIVTVGLPQYNITTKDAPTLSTPTGTGGRGGNTDKHTVTVGLPQYNRTKETPNPSEIRGHVEKEGSVSSIPDLPDELGHDYDTTDTEDDENEENNEIEDKTNEAMDAVAQIGLM